MFRGTQQILLSLHSHYSQLRFLTFQKRGKKISITQFRKEKDVKFTVTTSDFSVILHKI